MRRGALILVIALLVVIVALVGLTVAGLQPRDQPDRQRFCFAEWCVAPLALRTAGGSTVVEVRVSSDAQAAAQRPDHPQAWLRGADGRVTGGPQAALERRIGPGAAYVASLTFPLPDGSGCATFTVGEGGWPAFLGLGYAPSPFGERADWRLCAASAAAAPA